MFSDDLLELLRLWWRSGHARGKMLPGGWLAARQAELVPVEYYHVVFTLPGVISDIAYRNKAVIYTILIKAAAETLITIAGDPKHLGARIGLMTRQTRAKPSKPHRPSSPKYRD